MDFNEDSATFWAIQKKIPKEVQNLGSYSQAKIDFLMGLAAKLKIVRDKTHFHIDKKAVMNPPEIWAQAGIKGAKLYQGLSYLWDMLRELYKLIYGVEFSDVVSRYDGKEVPLLLDWAHSQKLILTAVDAIRA